MEAALPNTCYINRENRARRSVDSRADRCRGRHAPSGVPESVRQAEFSIQPVRIGGAQRPSPQALKMRMRRRVHQRFRQSAAAVRLDDEHIGEIRERRIVGTHARSRPASRRRRSRSTVSSQSSARRPRAALLRPNTNRRKKIVDDVEVESRGIGADEEFTIALQRRRRARSRARVGCGYSEMSGSAIPGVAANRQSESAPAVRSGITPAQKGRA